MSSTNQVISELNNMTLNKTIPCKTVLPSFLGGILTSMHKLESQNKLTALQVAHIRLQLVIDKHPNATHNKKNPHLQKQYKDAKKYYNTLLEKHCAEIDR